MKKEITIFDCTADSILQLTGIPAIGAMVVGCGFN